MFQKFQVLYFKGLDKVQLEWLSNQLQLCKESNKKAIICGHIPINVNAGHCKNKPYNHEEIQAVIHSHKDTCVAYFAGHYHDGGNFKDDDDILHITFPCIVEKGPDNDSFSIVEVYNNRVEVKIVTDDVKIFEIEI